ncbi:Ig-like domain-containing protein [Verrucomicrobiota bacterium sgz303538]
MQKRTGTLFGLVTLFTALSTFVQAASTSTAVNDKAVLGNGVNVVVPVLANDTLNSTTPVVVVVRGAKFGRVIPVPGATPDEFLFAYTAGPNFPGYDSFQYTIADQVGGAESAPATVTIFGPRFSFAGAHGAPIKDRDGKQVGYLRLDAMSSGAFSGKVEIGTKEYSLVGHLDRNGRFVGYARADDEKVVALSLSVIDKGGVSRITGTFGGRGEWTVSQEVGDLTTKGLARIAGRYTVELPASSTSIVDDSGNDNVQNEDEDGRRVPQGAGWMVIEVNKFGGAQLEGKTADGRSFSASAQIAGSDADPVLPFYIAWDASILSGTLSMGETVAGSLSWSLEKTDDELFPDGFAVTVPANGSRYIEPEDRDRVLRNSTNDGGRAELKIAGGGVPDFTRELRFSENDEVSVIEEGDDRVGLEVDRRHGIFKGTFHHPDDPKQRVSFSGVLLQNQGRGSGLFERDTKTGRVELTVTVSDNNEEN